MDGFKMLLRGCLSRFVSQGRCRCAAKATSAARGLGCPGKDGAAHQGETGTWQLRWHGGQKTAGLQGGVVGRGLSPANGRTGWDQEMTWRTHSYPDGTLQPER